MCSVELFIKLMFGVCNGLVSINEHLVLLWLCANRCGAVVTAIANTTCVGLDWCPITQHWSRELMNTRHLPHHVYSYSVVHIVLGTNR